MRGRIKISAALRLIQVASSSSGSRFLLMGGESGGVQGLDLCVSFEIEVNSLKAVSFSIRCE